MAAYKDDRALVIAHQAGDADAFDALVREYRPRLVTRAEIRLRCRDAAEDAVQETLVRALRALPRFNGEYMLGPWLQRILDNVCHDESKRRARESMKVDRLTVSPDYNLFDEHGPEDDLGLDMDNSSLLSAFKDLPENYQEALRLRVVEELSYPEVAAQTDVSEENARARVSRASRALRTALKGAMLLPVIGALLPLLGKALAGTALLAVVLTPAGDAPQAQLTPAQLELVRTLEVDGNVAELSADTELGAGPVVGGPDGTSPDGTGTAGTDTAGTGPVVGGPDGTGNQQGAAGPDSPNLAGSNLAGPNLVGTVGTPDGDNAGGSNQIITSTDAKAGDPQADNPTAAEADAQQDATDSAADSAGDPTADGSTSAANANIDISDLPPLEADAPLSIAGYNLRLVEASAGSGTNAGTSAASASTISLTGAVTMQTADGFVDAAINSTSRLVIDHSPQPANGAEVAGDQTSVDAKRHAISGVLAINLPDGTLARFELSGYVSHFGSTMLLVQGADLTANLTFNSVVVIPVDADVSAREALPLTGAGSFDGTMKLDTRVGSAELVLQRAS